MSRSHSSSEYMGEWKRKNPDKVKEYNGTMSPFLSTVLELLVD